MNIKKIIRENIDDLEWIRNVQTNHLYVGNLIFISPINTNAVKWPHHDNNSDKNFIILRITNINDTDVFYNIVVSTIDRRGNSLTVDIVGAKNLINNGYWRILDPNIPKELLNNKADTKDILPYVIYDGANQNINESDEWEWVREIKPYPTLQELFDAGKIEKDDVLTLRGMVTHGRTYESQWVNDFTITIKTIKDDLTMSDFNIDPSEVDVIEAMGTSGYAHIAFLRSDGGLEVIKKNDQPTQLTESDEWDWVREAKPEIWRIEDFEIGMVGDWYYKNYEITIKDCEVIYIEDDFCGVDCVMVRLNENQDHFISWGCPDGIGKCLWVTGVDQHNPFIVKSAKENINESDEWEWARQVPGIPMVGDRIRVINIGDEEAFLRWLGDYREKYERGYYGDNIEGIVVWTDMESSRILINTEDKPSSVDIISFPILDEETINDLKINVPNNDYYGLDIKYEPI
jgi:hypothetical protein